MQFCRSRASGNPVNVAALTRLLFCDQTLKLPLSRRELDLRRRSHILRRAETRWKEI
jgi:hypothetical protein